MKVRAKKHRKSEAGLVTVAKSIGSTIGLIVGRVNAAQRAVAHSAPVRSMRRRRKTVLTNRKKAVTTAATRRKRVKRAGIGQRVARRKNASAKRGGRS
jgi:hypothetical protein